jgi:hypothetical protein
MSELDVHQPSFNSVHLVSTGLSVWACPISKVSRPFVTMF